MIAETVWEHRDSHGCEITVRRDVNSPGRLMVDIGSCGVEFGPGEAENLAAALLSAAGRDVMLVDRTAPIPDSTAAWIIRGWDVERQGCNVQLLMLGDTLTVGQARRLAAAILTATEETAS